MKARNSDKTVWQQIEGPSEVKRRKGGKDLRDRLRVEGAPREREGAASVFTDPNPSFYLCGGGKPQIFMGVAACDIRAVETPEEIKKLLTLLVVLLQHHYHMCV